MKRLILAGLVAVLAACGTAVQPEAEVNGVEGQASLVNPFPVVNSSFSNLHTLGTGGIPSAHRSVSMAKAGGITFRVDSSIPRNSVFEIDLGMEHNDDLVWVSVSPSVPCTWVNLSKIRCAPSTIFGSLSVGTYTITVRERGYTTFDVAVSTGQWYTAWQTVNVGKFLVQNMTLQ